MPRCWRLCEKPEVSPITHFLVSWTLAQGALEDDHDIGLVALAGVLPDIDAAGAAGDIFNQLVGRPPTEFYAAGHHWLFHGLFGCLCLAVVAGLLARRKALVFGLALLTAHLHLLCDLVGSRGPDDFWPIFYLGPFSRQAELQWSGQWRLDSWQNVTLTVILLVWMFRQAWRWGRSPLSLVSARAHSVFVETLRGRFGQP